jgi:ribosomal protein S18 acetylase RimI-like enzyme
MTQILTDLSPASLTTAVKANLYAYFGSLCHSPVADFWQDAHTSRWHTPIAHSWFNGLLSNQDPAADAAQLIDETLDYFRSRHVSSFTWWLAPHLQPAAWSAHLLPRGFQHDTRTPGMAVDLNALSQPATPASLEIRRVEDPETLAVWVGVCVRGFGMPQAMEPHFLELFSHQDAGMPLYSYLGSLEGTPVAAATMILGAGVAGIYNVATLPEARGKGAGTAVTLAPLLEARQMGYRAGILQSSEMGFNVYRRLGFQKLGQVDYFEWQAEGARHF